MAITRTETLTLGSEGDVVHVRHVVRSWANELRFGIVDQTKLTTAASELGRNTLIYGKGGTVTLQELREAGRVGIRAIFEDKGPGIPDIAVAMADGYTSGSGLGLGLGGSKRLMHEFTIETKLGSGTRITIAHYKKT